MKLVGPPAVSEWDQKLVREGSPCPNVTLGVTPQGPHFSPPFPPLPPAPASRTTLLAGPRTRRGGGCGGGGGVGSWAGAGE